MRSFGTVFVRSYSLLFHPDNILNIQNSIDFKEVDHVKIGNEKCNDTLSNQSKPENPKSNINLYGLSEDKGVYCRYCGSRLGSFLDEKEPNYVIELLKDRISFEVKPFYSTTRRIFVELLDFYRWK